jgi:uncharacterized protein (TIGR03435 family)
MKQLGPAKKLLLSAALAAALIVPIAFGSLGAAPARAQVKEESTAVTRYLSVTISTDGFSAEIRHNQSHMMTSNGTPLRKSIAFAYDVDASLVLGGPEWIDQRIYYIVGRLPPETPKDDGFAEWRARDKAMLADRFSLLVRSETRQLPAYLLTADAGGKNLTPIPEAPQQNHRVQVETPSDQPRDTPLSEATLTKIRGEAASMENFAGTLALMMGHPVLDRTGLKGNFDFEMTGNLNASTVTGALHEQLGLTLKSSLEPMTVIVVDKIQRPTLDPILQPAWHYPIH